MEIAVSPEVVAAAHPSAETEGTYKEADAGRIGVWLFILSEILLFGAFLASYFSTRLGNPDCGLGVSVWPEVVHLPGVALATLNTMILLTSSYTMVSAITRGERGDAAGMRRNLAATLTLGACFLVVKGVEYALKISRGYYPGSDLANANGGLSVFLSYYYLLTILHGLHVIAGLIWNASVLRSLGKAGLPAAARKAELAGLYWHFVDVVWVFLFPLLYLI